MKLPLTATTFIALLASSSAFAANLTIPLEFEYIAIDGKEISTNSFTHKSELELTEGTHKIAIRYYDLVDDGFSDSQSFVKSDPFIVEFNASGNNEYILKPADGDFVRNPKTFAKSPEVVISRADNVKVDYTVQQTGVKESSFIASLFGNTASTNQPTAVSVTSAAGATQASPAVAQTATTAAVATSVTQEKAATATTTPTQAQNNAKAEQMLQYWWSEADENTRKQFMSWAIKQL